MEITCNSVIPISHDSESLMRSLDFIDECISFINVEPNIPASSRYSMLDYWLGQKSFLESFKIN